MKKIIIIIIMSALVLTSGCGTKNNRNVKDLSQYFEGYDGSFILYDQSKNETIVYNDEKNFKQISPCSTFKIYHSLIGLETGVLKDENTTFKWDGTNYPFKEWNRNQTLSTAISNSVVWYFQQLAPQIGEERMKQYLNKIDYGNKDISSGITNFWLHSSLKISPQEQVDLLKKFYNYELPFSRNNIDIVKKAIVLKKENNTILSGKTGSAIINNESISGWFVGYVEKGSNVYFFATNIEAEKGATSAQAKDITIKILKKLYEINLATATLYTIV